MLQDPPDVHHHDVERQGFAPLQALHQEGQTQASFSPHGRHGRDHAAGGARFGGGDLEAPLPFATIFRHQCVVPRASRHWGGRHPCLPLSALDGFFCSQPFAGAGQSFAHIDLGTATRTSPSTTYTTTTSRRTSWRPSSSTSLPTQVRRRPHLPPAPCGSPATSTRSLQVTRRSSCNVPTVTLLMANSCKSDLASGSWRDCAASWWRYTRRNPRTFHRVRGPCGASTASTLRCLHGWRRSALVTLKFLFALVGATRTSSPTTLRCAYARGQPSRNRNLTGRSPAWSSALPSSRAPCHPRDRGAIYIYIYIYIYTHTHTDR